MDSETQQENTYFMDPESPVEMGRLINLDHVMTAAMGGPLSNVPDLPEAAKVLDLACGPGSWVLDVAFACPDIEVAGVDISRIMIDYANARARTQQLFNTSFGVMNITEPLDFSDRTFDLVNARTIGGVLHRESWEPFLAECMRILKPDGLFRLTEPVDPVGTTNSPAYERIVAMSYQAFQRAGYSFSVDGRTLGLTTVLPRMLRKAGYHNVRGFAHFLEFSADCEAWQDMYRNMEAVSSTIPPFFVKTGMATQAEIEQLYQQAFTEMHSNTFCGVWHFLTLMGEKP
jgi:ubiquinone/menaquinone biosynthesis C-methylase UbiE